MAVEGEGTFHKVIIYGGRVAPNAYREAYRDPRNLSLFMLFVGLDMAAGFDTGFALLNHRRLLDQRSIYDKILSALFFARKTTDEAAMLTPNEIKNKTMPMKNNT